MTAGFMGNCVLLRGIDYATSEITTVIAFDDEEGTDGRARCLSLNSTWHGHGLPLALQPG